LRLFDRSRIAYYPNQYETESGVPYYTLTFTVSFPHEADVCYFAHCIPYGYTDLERCLADVLGRAGAHEFVRMSTLCTSLTGNKVPLPTVV
jgi:hypothetical protein